MTDTPVRFDRGCGRCRTVGRLLAVTLLAGMAGSLADLLLIEHHEDRVQLVPIALLGAGIASCVLHLLVGRRATLRALQAVMVAFGIAGMIGVYMHFRGNREFALERGMEGGALFWDSIHGVPPVLAPAAMVYLGLLGLVHAHAAGSGAAGARSRPGAGA